MKIVRFERLGAPDKVCACVEVPDPGPPGPGEVVVEVEAFPINPVDLLTIEGRYATVPELPATPGSEAAGRIVGVGEGVDGLHEGDHVMLLSRDNWVQRRRVDAKLVVPVPRGADIRQMAMLKVNPATAALLLREIVPLEPGEWVVQDAANSAVGRNLIALAREAGVRTVNVVRREDVAGALGELGADAVLVDGHELPARVADVTGGAPIRLAIDAIAGSMCTRLADCLADGGTVVNYGLLSGAPCELRADQVIFRDIRLTGFWLVRALGAMAPEDVRALYADLARKVVDGAIGAPVEAEYRLERIAEALAHAAREGRDGKIVVAPNAPA